MREYIVICAWHEKYHGYPLEMGRKKVAGAGKDLVSHGICPECARIVKQNLKEHVNER